jgi:hypothetical protein
MNIYQSKLYLILRQINSIVQLIVQCINDKTIDELVMDNGCGAIAKIIIAHRENINQLDALISLLLDHLPLKKDLEENESVYICLFELIYENNNSIQKLLPKILKFLSKYILNLNDTYQSKTVKCIKYLEEKFSNKIYNELDSEEIENLKKAFNNNN